MKAAPWFETWFNSPEYDLVYQHRTREEADRFVQRLVQTLNLPVGSRVSDIACGRGRHALAFARLGMEVHGYDLSRRALQIAQERAEEEGLHAHFHVHDKRFPVCEQCSDLVVNLFTAFGYFASDAEHREALHAMVQSVKPGGFFVQDFLNPAFVEATLVTESQQEFGDLYVRVRKWIDGGRVHKALTLHRGGEQHAVQESVALIPPEHIAGWLREAGLTVVHHWGTYFGDAWSPVSPRSILIAQA